MFVFNDNNRITRSFYKIISYIILEVLLIILSILLWTYINNTILKLFCLNNISTDCHDNSSLVLTFIIVFIIDCMIIIIYILLSNLFFSLLSLYYQYDVIIDNYHI
jgi:hypothetical protein